MIKISTSLYIWHAVERGISKKHVLIFLRYLRIIQLFSYYSVWRYFTFTAWKCIRSSSAGCYVWLFVLFCFPWQPPFLYSCCFCCDSLTHFCHNGTVWSWSVSFEWIGVQWKGRQTCKRGRGRQKRETGRGERERERGGGGGGQTDRQTETETDRERQGEAETQTDRQKKRQTERQRQRATEWETKTERVRERNPSEGNLQWLGDSLSLSLSRSLSHFFTCSLLNFNDTSKHSLVSWLLLLLFFFFLVLFFVFLFLRAGWGWGGGWYVL